MPRTAEQVTQVIYGNNPRKITKKQWGRYVEGTKSSARRNTYDFNKKGNN